MKITQRLYLAALPSAVGVVTVAALAYWGQFARSVPEIFLVIALVATISTFAVSWSNVRYVALRVERLARSSRKETTAVARLMNNDPAYSGVSDEFDSIEGAVANLSGAVQLATDDRARALADAQRRNREHVQLLATVTSAALEKLNDVRLPLHILLENHFGDLNENQEEMLGAARSAAESIDEELTSMSELASLELGEITFRRDRVFPADVLNAILPTLRAQAAGRGIELRAEIAPLVPAFRADAVRLQRAMLVLLSGGLDKAEADGQALLSLNADHKTATVTLMPACAFPETARTLLARRVIIASGGEVQERLGVLIIRLHE